jgi:transmembrane sensor
MASIEEQVLDVIISTSEDSAAANDALRELLARSPQHVGAYLQLEALWQSLADPELAEPIRRAATGKRRPWRWMMAAALALLALSAVEIWKGRWQQTHCTSVGEIDSVQLSDRSVIFLNSDSRIETAYTESERRVILLYGEATFEVAQAPDRPFVVESGATRIIVTGTEFAVRREGESTTVTVLEGEVIVESDYSAYHGVAGAPDGGARPVQQHHLSSGKKLVLQRDSPATVEVVESESVAWRPRRLVVDTRALSEVVAEFNRLNVEQIELEGDLRDLHVSGIFDLTDPVSLLEFLGTLDGIVIEHASDEVIRVSR